MERYINSYATENDIQIALQNGELLKPYVAYIEDADRIDWNSKEIVDYTTEYLTFNILSAGTINWTTTNLIIFKVIKYKVNDGEWVSINSTVAGAKINVNSGDKIQFKGNNAAYSDSSYKPIYSTFSGSTAEFEVEGNIMSLIYEDDFKNNSTISSSHTFYGLFQGCINLVSAENLILPATTLADSCYRNMFQNCNSLTTAPELPATTLAQSCYNSMFQGCTKLNYIKCLATDISASDCTYDWVDGVSSTGTFVKASSMTSWTTGANGIPTGWTVQDA